MKANQTTLRGFTLVELTIVMVIVALLLGGLLVPLSAQQDVRQLAETEKQLTETRDALVGYAQINGRLPCPSSDQNGKENRDAVTLQCARPYGFLPWVELGVRPADPWGRLLSYRVSSAFSQSGTNGTYPVLTTAAAAQLQILGRNPDNSQSELTNGAPLEVVFVILSHGKNGYHGINTDGSVGPTDIGITNPDEDTNRDAVTTIGTTRFISRTFTPSSTPTIGAFDDQLLWVPRSVLINRLITAGKITS